MPALVGLMWWLTTRPVQREQRPDPPTPAEVGEAVERYALPLIVVYYLTSMIATFDSCLLLPVLPAYLRHDVTQAGQLPTQLGQLFAGRSHAAIAAKKMAPGDPAHGLNDTRR